MTLRGRLVIRLSIKVAVSVVTRIGRVITGRK